MKRERPQMDPSILDRLGDAVIVSVDKNAEALTMDLAHTDCLPTPIRRLRFADYSIIEDTELAGSTWHRHRLIAAGAVTQRLELTVYVRGKGRKATRRQFILQFKRMEIIPQ